MLTTFDTNTTNLTALFVTFIANTTVGIERTSIAIGTVKV